MRKRPAFFTPLGVIFLLIGAFTAFNVISGLYLGHVFLWRAASYGLIDLLVAWGFFKAQWWLLPAFALTLAGQVIFLATRLTQGPVSSASILFSGLGLVLAGGIFWYLNQSRKMLKRNNTSYVFGAVFFISWVYGFWYTLSTLMH